MQKLPGNLWPVMLTPFKEEGDIDMRGLEALTEFYLEKGATGLFTNCLSSEMFQLTPEERISLTQSVVRFAAGRAAVVSTGTFTLDPWEQVDFIHRLADLGVACVVLNSNQICLESERESVFRSRLENLASSTGNIPLGMYECPEPYKRLLTDDTVTWMAASGRFLYLKDTCCDIDIIRSRLSVSSTSPLGIYNAHTPTGLPSLREGAAGLSPIGANFYPELYSYICAHAEKERSPDLVRVEQFLLANDALLHANYPFSAKWFLQRRGLPISTKTRSRIPEVPAEHLSKLEELLSGRRELVERIGLPL
jgi:4-hydroxy-tetrahydrodipicolinate synthase